MSDQFFKVSYVRRDGRVGETTILGDGAEGYAFTIAKGLQGRNMAYIRVTQRVDGGEGVLWEQRLAQVAPKEAE